MAWNYKRTGEDGKLYSYYGQGQEWTYDERGRRHTMTVKYFTATPDGVQYYWVSIDGKFQETRMSAARLHYLLNSKKAIEVKGGTLQPMPLLLEEVEAYFEKDKWTDCPDCGGNGVDRGKICRCAERLTYVIKAFNAKKRLADLMKV